jgi:hypothetical protein
VERKREQQQRKELLSHLLLLGSRAGFFG